MLILFLVSLCFHSRGQSVEQRLKSFADGPLLGGNSQAPLLQGFDGNLYGTTDYGGSYGCGVVFRLNTNGGGYTVLHAFGSGTDGQFPQAPLSQDSNGMIYGTTGQGGTAGKGAVFKLNTNGSGYTILHNFTISGLDGQTPLGALLQGADGALYGTTYRGGSNNYGAIFKINRDGSGYARIHEFTGGVSDGISPLSRLIQDADGLLYGSTQQGGSANYGTIFKINTYGTSFTVIHHFTILLGEGLAPHAGLVQDTNGVLYGTTPGGPGTKGTVFKLNSDGSGYQLLYSIGSNAGDGQSPYCDLLLANDGALYGTTSGSGNTPFAGGTVFRLNTDGSSYAVLRDFSLNLGDGQYPLAGLIQAGDGALYSTASSGGANGNGAIFKINTDGSDYAVLYSAEHSDGQKPHATVIQDNDGALYGTTYNGGDIGAGTIFKLNPDGSGYRILHSFGDATNDGQNPQGGLLQAADGLLYGTTVTDYRPPNGTASGYGSVFSLNPDGTGYTTIYKFDGINGSSPTATLIQGNDGALYGAGAAAVFKLNTNGLGYQVLHTFTNTGLDGRGSISGLLQATDNFLYGETSAGGSTATNGFAGYGTLFKLSPDGNDYSIVHNFRTNGYDGVGPFGGLIQGGDGALFGITGGGGSNNAGTVFRLNTNGSGFITLHSFRTNGGDGTYPLHGLSRGSDGLLYGATFSGGAFASGTVFRLAINGTDYAVIYSFRATGGDGNGPLDLTQGSDQALYGTTIIGGDMGNGIVFRLLAPPEFTAITRAPDKSIQLTLNGFPNVPYRLESSTNLFSWSRLADLTNSIPAVHYTDLTAPNFSKRFYRAVWAQ